MKSTTKTKLKKLISAGLIGATLSSFAAGTTTYGSEPELWRQETDFEFYLIEASGDPNGEGIFATDYVIIVPENLPKVTKSIILTKEKLEEIKNKYKEQYPDDDISKKICVFGIDALGKKVILNQAARKIATLGAYVCEEAYEGELTYEVVANIEAKDPTQVMWFVKFKEENKQRATNFKFSLLKLNKELDKSGEYIDTNKVIVTAKNLPEETEDITLTKEKLKEIQNKYKEQYPDDDISEKRFMFNIQNRGKRKVFLDEAARDIATVEEREEKYGKTWLVKFKEETEQSYFNSEQSDFDSQNDFTEMNNYDTIIENKDSDDGSEDNIQTNENKTDSCQDQHIMGKEERETLDPAELFRDEEELRKEIKRLSNRQVGGLIYDTTRKGTEKSNEKLLKACRGKKVVIVVKVKNGGIIGGYVDLNGEEKPHGENVFYLTNQEEGTFKDKEDLYFVEENGYLESKKISGDYFSCMV